MSRERGLIPYTAAAAASASKQQRPRQWRRRIAPRCHRRSRRRRCDRELRAHTASSASRSCRCSRQSSRIASAIARAAAWGRERAGAMSARLSYKRPERHCKLCVPAAQALRKLGPRLRHHEPAAPRSACSKGALVPPHLYAVSGALRVRGQLLLHRQLRGGVLIRLDRYLQLRVGPQVDDVLVAQRVALAWGRQRGRRGA